MTTNQKSEIENKVKTDGGFAVRRLTEWIAPELAVAFASDLFVHPTGNLLSHGLRLCHLSHGVVRSMRGLCFPLWWWQLPILCYLSLFPSAYADLSIPLFVCYLRCWDSLWIHAHSTFLRMPLAAFLSLVRLGSLSDHFQWLVTQAFLVFCRQGIVLLLRAVLAFLLYLLV